MAKINLRIVQTPSSAVDATTRITGRWKRRLRLALAQLQRNPLLFFRTLLPHIAVFRVYGIDTTHCPDRIVLPGVSFAALADDELMAVSVGEPEFKNRQCERFRRFGRSSAYVARYHDQIAHISWLLPSTEANREELMVLSLKPHEVEITACETRAAYRGRGIYKFVIRELIAHAASLGIRRVLMKTTWSNKISQKGITGAGLTAVSVALVLSVPGRNITPVVLTWTLGYPKRKAEPR